MDNQRLIVLNVPENVRRGLRPYKSREEQESLLYILFWSVYESIPFLENNDRDDAFIRWVRQSYFDWAYNQYLEPLTGDILNEAEDAAFEKMWERFEGFSQWMDERGDWLWTGELFQQALLRTGILDDRELELDVTVNCRRWTVEIVIF